MSEKELDLCKALRDLPKHHGNRYTGQSEAELLKLLFSHLSNGHWLHLFFPNGTPGSSPNDWNLKKAHRITVGSEYTEGARGAACGHLFSAGESTYRCKTCTVDDCCVLCERCLLASDHEGHVVVPGVALNASACCDCGDHEAWVRRPHCSIHSELSSSKSRSTGKSKDGSDLPDDLLQSVRMTIARALDFVCDVFSCSPEQLRLPKAEIAIREDERLSRLNSRWYGDESEDVPASEEEQEFSLIVWNDEKHTIQDLKEQIARACKERKSFGLAKAQECDEVGRAIVLHSKNLQELLNISKIIEEIKVTTTIRSSRDTFREQMCYTILVWLEDIASFHINGNGNLLRTFLCQEMLKGWRVGSKAHRASIGQDGLDDRERDDRDLPDDQDKDLTEGERLNNRNRTVSRPQGADDEDDDAWDDDDEHVEDADDEDDMDVDLIDQDADMEMDTSDVDGPDDSPENRDTTFGGYPPPPPPPPAPADPRANDPTQTPVDSDEGEPQSSHDALTTLYTNVPRTTRVRVKAVKQVRPPKYWLAKPKLYNMRRDLQPHEDLWQRVRLDFLILYDLRMWKNARKELRDMLVRNTVQVPSFKRLLSLRFAGLYTPLAQLYLIADREPDHSIIKLSSHMLNTQVIAVEVTERGNLLTNLFSILYTFLTTRQVSYPSDINPLASLAFESGAVNNRRLGHFYTDARFMLDLEHVREKICTESRYLLQFLDVVKLHQGICPTVRALGEHVEYESDAWVAASIATKEVNKLCRLVSEAFHWTRDQDPTYICNAIRNAAKVVIINSLGSERRRFQQSDLKTAIRFKSLQPFDFDPIDPMFGRTGYEIVNFSVDKEPMSFHHALHYMLSWLIDRGKAMDREQLLGLLLFSVQDLREAPSPPRATIMDLQSDQYLLAMFEIPLRLLAWFPQIKNDMWVRNGHTLRHQLTQYRGFTVRYDAFQRDIFMLQVALIVCSPATFLLSMIDRFQVMDWVRGNYQIQTGMEEKQKIDVAEDFIHLLIILLSERTNLVPLEDCPNPRAYLIRREIAHILCFKPLPNSSIHGHLPEPAQSSEEYEPILREMTKFRPPEGLSDSGTFELKPEYLELVDPYIAHYSRNQREEAENIYKKNAAKNSGKSVTDVVYEPKLREISSGIFKDLPAFTRTPIFAQIIYSFLRFALLSSEVCALPSTRVEAFLHFILHLTLLAVKEDTTPEADMGPDSLSFVNLALTKRASFGSPENSTIISILQTLSTMDSFRSCEAKVKLIVHRIHQKQPRAFASAISALNLGPDRMDTASPASNTAVDKELKKKQALERQARVMAQFKEQQSSFMANQAIDWGEEDFSDLEEEEDESMDPGEEHIWKYPTGTCIYCQEETNDERLYGTFAFMTESNIMRQTDLTDSDWISEVAECPINLDRSAEDIRPFGVSGRNKYTVESMQPDGTQVIKEYRGLGKGFPKGMTDHGPVTIGCAHMMHYSCFEGYMQATQRRHINQIARNHPERPDMKEFVCPLCKALGNAFLPVIWKGKVLTYPGVLQTEVPFDEWLVQGVPVQISKLEKGPEKTGMDNISSLNLRLQRLFLDYGTQEIIPPLADKLPDLTRSNYVPVVPSHVQHRLSIPSFIPMPLDEPGPHAPVLSDGGQAASHSLPMLELVRIYQRLRDTMRVNGLYTRHEASNTPLGHVEDLTYTDTLARTLGFSIAAAEIAQRGAQSDSGSTLLDKISMQSLTHLRVLSETVSSYLAVGGLRNNGSNKAGKEYIDTQTRQLQQLFLGHPVVYNPEELPSETISITPLLSIDSFIFLAECSACLAPAMRFDIHHIMRLCYIAEIVRVVVAYLEQADLSSMPLTHREADALVEKEIQLETGPDEPHNFERFVTCIGQECGRAKLSVQDPDDPSDRYGGYRDPLFQRRLHMLIPSYALTFLRKSLVLMNVRYGVEFPTFGSDPNSAELHRLTQFLHLPTLNEVFAMFSSDRDYAIVARHIVNGWIQHYIWNQANTRGNNRSESPYINRCWKPTTISLSHPGIMELIGLPEAFDYLMRHQIATRCPTTGKEITDAVLCLFCGDVMCSQGTCCLVDKLGGAQRHRLHSNNIRRKHRLFLSQKRYDGSLRQAWLMHQVPTIVARKLEQEVNNGGWESL
ncbi:hypothetical protein M501DRAFT_476221 [Patellaria atrata CBS 101060]|uniref:E3 ubiquitin-protein ligase n=1 Tax=Patellaria atrata CBS 101060 TaxID=1346257 RepID=A0A9P4VMA9_9PEZI|nr:hypothetical protein M501DRAFT_476221 [Patellaria atrata CBS 101060]